MSESVQLVRRNCVTEQSKPVPNSAKQTNKTKNKNRHSHSEIQTSLETRQISADAQIESTNENKQKNVAVRELAGEIAGGFICGSKKKANKIKHKFQRKNGKMESGQNVI